MKTLFLGDVIGRAGRTVVLKEVPRLIKELSLDWVIVNGENAASGFGITPDICEEFFKAGVDCITTGNHAWAQRTILPYMAREPRLLRPLNYQENTPGQGAVILEKSTVSKRLVVMNVMTRLFMEPFLEDPFVFSQEALKKYMLSDRSIGGIFVDVHGEASSEKMALAHFLDGKVSAVVGTHTHIPTGDAQILEKGTAYQTDAGMCGDYNSVIGMQKDIAVSKFTRKLGEKNTPALGEATLCGVYIETHEKTGLATKISPLRVGPRLMPHWPV